ncbi:tetratricopeptide repeat protein [Streptacidiphilus cavernicola]|uniref:Tetratricopeptide repeat protein n=1 Tax=Streptacidiphilus cavernicola TaxID=3342716 RepID=A0ABV6VSM3_9ACTN
MPEQVLVQRADEEAAQGRHAEALELYARAWESRHDEVAEKLLDLVEDWGDVDAALEVLQRTADQGVSGAYEALAALLVEIEEPEEALKALQEAHERGREVALWTAAVLADELDDREQAEAWYRRAIDAAAAGALNDFGVFLSDDPDRLVEAEEVLTLAVERGDPMALGNLGRMHLEAERPEEALRWLRRGLDAGVRSVLVPMAEAEQQLGDYAAARERLAEALDDEIEGAQLAWANFCAEHGTPEEQASAEGEFLSALEQEEVGAHFDYAVFLADRDRLDEAVEQYTAAADEGETNAWLNLALIHEDRKDRRTAEECYRSGIDAGDLHALLAYAEFLRQWGRQKDIPALYGQAEALGADAEELTQLRTLAG